MGLVRLGRLVLLRRHHLHGWLLRLVVMGLGICREPTRRRLCVDVLRRAAHVRRRRRHDREHPWARARCRRLLLLLMLLMLLLGLLQLWLRLRLLRSTVHHPCDGRTAWRSCSKGLPPA
jgi:hypothetical protein